MITAISGFVFFLSKSGRFVTHNCFCNNALLKTPIFIGFFGCALSGPSCQKKAIWTPPKNRKFWLITEKLFFLAFLCFLLRLSFFFFFVFLFCFVFFFVIFVFLFCLFVFCFSFPFFASNRQTCFPPRQGYFCVYFWVSPFVSLSLFWPSPFSISLSLSLSCSFLSFFLLVFRFCCFLLLLGFCLFLSFSFFFAFVSLKSNIKIFNYKVFLHQYFLFFWVSCLVFSLKSLFLIFVLSWF